MALEGIATGICGWQSKKKAKTKKKKKKHQKYGMDLAHACCRLEYC
jgi:hypothetical protein